LTDTGRHGGLYELHGITAMTEELLDVVVRKRELHGDGVVVLDLTRRDGAPLPTFDAGAHVDIHIGPGLVRQYSLCSNPARRA